LSLEIITNVGDLIVHLVGSAPGAVNGEANPDRPGSESGAKVQEGFLRNLGDPMIDHLVTP
jgi:hypothetical protein